MYAQVNNGEVTRIIKSPIAITVDGIQHPRNIFTVWSTADLQAIGIYPYREEKVNNRYYWSGNVAYSVTESEVVGSYTEIDRDVDQLKENMISKVRSTVASRLSESDWMVIREMDGGTACPADVKAYRATLREESNTKETEINALTTLADVMLYENTPFTEVRKVKHTDEDGIETYGPETEENTREIDLCTHFTTDPQAEVDPAFVSLVLA